MQKVHKHRIYAIAQAAGFLSAILWAYYTGTLGLPLGWVLFCCSVAVIAGTSKIDPDAPVFLSPANDLVTLATAVLLVMAATLFRWLHFSDVPVAYNGENLEFLKFAQFLRKEGFPYVPFSWYAHTLLSYVIGFASYFVGMNTDAIRLGSFVNAIVTVLLCFLCTRVASGNRTAIIAAILLTVSPMHQHTTRTGFHHQFIVTAQFGMMYCLLATICKPKKIRYAIAAVVFAALGFHSHYGGYGLLVLLPAIVSYMFLFHRPQWLQTRRSLGLMITLTVLVLGFQLYKILAFESMNQALTYFMGHFQQNYHQPAPDQNVLMSWVAKMQRQSIILADMVFGLMNGGSFTRLWTPLVGAGFVVGMGVALRNWRSRPDYFLLLIMLAIYVGAELLLEINIQYVAVLIMPIVIIASIGINGMVVAFVGHFPTPLKMACSLILAVGILGYEGMYSYKEFFRAEWILSLTTAEGTSGRYFLDMIRQDLQTKRVLITKVGEDENLYGSLATLEGLNDEYKFLRDIETFSTDMVLIPRMLELPIRAIKVYFQRSTATELAVEGVLSKVYPGAIRQSLPWPGAEDRGISVASTIEISAEEILRVRGLTSNPAEKRHQGLFLVNKDDEIALKVGPGVREVSIDGVPVHTRIIGDSAFFAGGLSKGTHLVSILCASFPCAEGAILKQATGAWYPLGQLAIQVSDSLLPVVAPFLGWRLKSDYPELVMSRKIEMNRPIDSLAISENGRILAISGKQLLRGDGQKDGTEIVPTDFGRPKFVFSEGREFIGMTVDGKIFALQGDNHASILSQAPCSPWQASYSLGTMLVVCIEGGGFSWSGQGWTALTASGLPTVKVWGADSQLLLGPNTGYFIDRATRTLSAYDRSFKKLQWRKFLSGAKSDMIYSVDTFGNLYAPQLSGGTLMITPGRELVMNMRTKSRFTLRDSDDALLEMLRSQISFNKNGGGLMKSSTLLLFSWRASEGGALTHRSH